MYTLETAVLNVNGVDLYCQSMGQGPLVVFCHGWPGLAYSWRHQMPALAAAGFKALALDMRGYGQSSRPVAVEAYSYAQQAADLLALLSAFDADKMVLVGHDFGANLAWYMALCYPQKLHAVVSVSVPYQMPLACGTKTQSPTELFAAIAREHFFHMHYFQSPGLAEAEFLGRERELLQKLFWALSADGNLLNWENFPMRGTGYLDVLETPPAALPWPWLSEEAFEYYLQAFLAQGADKAFVGGLNAYRVLDNNYQLARDYLGVEVTIPACFIAGAQDPVLALTPQECWDVMAEKVPHLAPHCIVPDAGHFVQQEQAQAFNTALLGFLRGLGSV